MLAAWTIGLAFGAAVGIIHAAAIFQTELGRREGTPNTRGLAVLGGAAYRAAWTFALWVLFGSYILCLWLLASLAYAANAGWRRLRSLRTG